MGRGFMSGNQQQKRGAQQLVFAQLRTLLFHRNQFTDQAAGRVGTFRLKPASQVAVQTTNAGNRRQNSPRKRSMRQALDPLGKAGSVFGGQAQQFADHDQRNNTSETVDQFDLRLTGQIVQQVVGQRRDSRLHQGDVLVAKRLFGETSQPAMIRFVFADHVVHQRAKRFRQIRLKIVTFLSARVLRLDHKPPAVPQHLVDGVVRGRQADFSNDGDLRFH